MHSPVVHGTSFFRLIQKTRHWVHHPETMFGVGVGIGGVAPRTWIRASNILIRDPMSSQLADDNSSWLLIYRGKIRMSNTDAEMAV